MLVRGLIIFTLVLTLMPRAPESKEPAPGTFAAIQNAVLADLAQVKADIAQSQRERGGSLLSL